MEFFFKSEYWSRAWYQVVIAGGGAEVIARLFDCFCAIVRIHYLLRCLTLICLSWIIFKEANIKFLSLLKKKRRGKKDLFIDWFHVSDLKRERDLLVSLQVCLLKRRRVEIIIKTLKLNWKSLGVGREKCRNILSLLEVVAELKSSGCHVNRIVVIEEKNGISLGMNQRNNGSEELSNEVQ